MNTVVWVMVMFGHGNYVNAGPEFTTQEKCEVAALKIAQSGKDRSGWSGGGTIKTPWCVKIEK